MTGTVFVVEYRSDDGRSCGVVGAFSSRAVAQAAASKWLRKPGHHDDWTRIGEWVVDGDDA